LQPEPPLHPEPPPVHPEPAPVQPEPPARVRIDVEPAAPATAAATGSLARAAAASLVILAVLAGALATVTTVKLAGDHVACGPVGSGPQLAEVATAASSVHVVLSYDYRHLDADFAAAERLLTPAFRKKYVDTTNKGVKPLAVKYKAIASADVTGAGLVSTTRGSCDHVLVLVQQTVTNSQLAQPRLDRSRIDVQMVRVKGRWLIGDLNPV
jgi:Mce-associated membrane protein